MSNRDKVIKDIAHFSGGTAIATVILMLREFVIAKFLSPTFYGIWHLVKMAIDYGRFMSLGMGWSMQKEIPYYYGKGNREKCEEIKNVAISSILVISAFLCILLVFIGIIFVSGTNNDISPAHIVLIICLIFMQQINNYLLMLLSAYQEFLLKSKTMVLQAALSVICIFLLIKHFKVYGVIFALFISYYITSVVIIFKMKYRFRFLINLKESFAMIKEGLAILANGFLLNVMETVDRILVVFMLNNTQLGYYGIAYALGRSVGLIPIAIGESLFPSMTEKYGAKENIKDIKSYVVKPQLVFAYFSPFVIGVVYFIVDFIILYFLPQYAAGRGAIKIMLICSFFSIINCGLVYFFFAIGSFSRVIYLRLISIFLEVVFVFVLLKYNTGINGAALGRSIGFMFFSIAMICFAYAYYENKARKIALFLTEILAPFLYTTCVILILDHLIKLTKDIYINIGIVLIKVILLSMACLPLWLYLNKRLNLWEEIKHLLEKNAYESGLN